MKWIVGVLALVVLVLGWQLRRAERRHQVTALRADSTAAANDRQRTLFVAGLAFQARRIVQMALARDSVDKALKQESRVRARLSLQVRDLTVELAAAVEDSAGTRRATFVTRQPPYSARADVALPSPPLPGKLALQIQLDSIVLHPRVTCGSAVDGVRPASLAVEGPTWAALRLEALESDAAVCNAKAGLPESGKWRVPVWLAGVGMAVSWVLGTLAH